ncbi:MAG: hypothetical protein C0412_19250 [Flavobacterium sp.]|nr:hypothetical protein [Flavobacterium sp.]
MSTSRLSKSTFLRNINIVIGFLSILIGTGGLLFFIYVLIEDVFFPGVMRIVGFASDMFFSTWVYLALFVYAGVQILKGKSKAKCIYQFIFIGLLIEYLGYRLIVDCVLIPSPVILIVYVGMLLYFNLPKVKYIMGVKKAKNKYKELGFQILLNVGIVTLSIIYFTLRFRSDII